jgi:hypothetical protein
MDEPLECIACLRLAYAGSVGARPICLLLFAVFLYHTIVTRSSCFTMRSSTLFRRAGLALVSLGLIIHSATAQDTWSITPNCNATGRGGGTFTDSLGATWEVKCFADLDGYTFHNEKTQSQGIYGCFKDCDNRPLCTGFVFVGEPNGNTGGTTGQTS